MYKNPGFHLTSVQKKVIHLLEVVGFACLEEDLVHIRENGKNLCI